MDNNELIPNQDDNNELEYTYDNMVNHRIHLIKYEIDSVAVYQRQQSFLTHYAKNRFNITKTCEDIDISTETFYDWKRRYPAFCDALIQYREMLHDLAEDTLYYMMQYSRNDAVRLDAAKFILKTTAKKRGYVEGLDITSNGKTMPIVNINIIKSVDVPNTEE